MVIVLHSYVVLLYIIAFTNGGSTLCLSSFVNRDTRICQS